MPEMRVHQTLHASHSLANARVADICEAFLDFSAKNHAVDTYRNHRFYIQSFCDGAGLLPVIDLRQYHVSRWVEVKEWNETSRYSARRFVFRTFSWAVGEGRQACPLGA